MRTAIVSLGLLLASCSGSTHKQAAPDADPGEMPNVYTPKEEASKEVQDTLRLLEKDGKMLRRPLTDSQ